VEQSGPHISSFGVDNHGLRDVEAAHWNYSTPFLYEAALRRREGELSIDGCLVTKTGEYTGRSPKDKFFVDEPSSTKEIWWGTANQAIAAEKFDFVHRRMVDYLRNREVFVQDLY
jgi:phosphoenolpyruvate carboxykinase (ATP)